MVVGVSPSCMDLELYSVSDKFMQKMDDNEALLGSYPVDDNCRIHVCSRSDWTLLIYMAQITVIL